MEYSRADYKYPFNIPRDIREGLNIRDLIYELMLWI